MASSKRRGKEGRAVAAAQRSHYHDGMSTRPKLAPGPFRADQIRCGDPYELSDGHPILAVPTGGRGSASIADGSLALTTDPMVQEAGIDTGYSPEPGTLRAPDIAIGNVPDEPGWVRGVPPLAVEYADRGQDEDELAAKIGELLAAGTKLIWVVRLAGARRVEVHEQGRTMRMVLPGEKLEAPGILKNAVPVEALYDPKASREVALSNLLQREGYRDLGAVRAEARSEGQLVARREALLTVVAARGWSLSNEQRDKLMACGDSATLDRWIARAAQLDSVDRVFE